MKKLIAVFVFSFILFGIHTTKAQLNTQLKSYTIQDTLRGSIGEGRNWWDVTHYAILVEPNFEQKSISGKVDISFTITGKGDKMQIDLQEPMQLEKAYLDDEFLECQRTGNVYFIKLKKQLPVGYSGKLSLKYSGKVKVAVRPPWDGGWIFSKDKLGRPWMSAACQGLGASVWFPCKDHQSDEPENGALLRISVPDTLMGIGNGRLIGTNQYKQGWKVYDWEVKNPINNYNIIPYIGKYVSFAEDFAGEKGNLNCSYWVLDYNLDKAKKQFKQVNSMLKAFEYWFGPYPFYEDGYKLVESPHLGMEHQSAIAYGNAFMNGYRGRDLSSTGHGLDWDFIIIHESGHEWFGNNITTKDIADMWVHEGFTNYSETLYTHYISGKAAGDAYLQGTRELIENRSPVIGKYGVNEEGSGDMYYKGGNLIHYIRQIMNDDEKFRLALREMNKRFHHATTTSAEVEAFWSEKAGIDLSSLFDQYLRTTSIPVFEFKIKFSKLYYRWTECNEKFIAPLTILINGNRKTVNPTTSWKKLTYNKRIQTCLPDKNFYVGYRQIN